MAKATIASSLSATPAPAKFVRTSSRLLIHANRTFVQSTVVRQLARILRIRLLHLDSIFWQANWVRVRRVLRGHSALTVFQTPFEEVRKKIKRVAYHDNWATSPRGTSSRRAPRTSSVRLTSPSGASLRLTRRSCCTSRASSGARSCASLASGSRPRRGATRACGACSSRPTASFGTR